MLKWSLCHETPVGTRSLPCRERAQVSVGSHQCRVVGTARWLGLQPFCEVRQARQASSHAFGGACLTVRQAFARPVHKSNVQHQGIGGVANSLQAIAAACRVPTNCLAATDTRTDPSAQHRDEQPGRLEAERGTTLAVGGASGTTARPCWQLDRPCASKVCHTPHDTTVCPHWCSYSHWVLTARAFLIPHLAFCTNLAMKLHGLKAVRCAL